MKRWGIKRLSGALAFITLMGIFRSAGYFAVSKIIPKSMRSSGFGIFKIFFMNCVALFEDAPTIRDMSDLLGCSHQNAKQILTKLEKQGFVEVQQDLNDKRKQRMILTNKAIEFRRHYDASSEETMQFIFEGISREELVTTISVFTRLNKNVDQLKGRIEL